MIPTSVKTRHCASYDFESCYRQLCDLQSTSPLRSVVAGLKEGVLDLNGDKIQMIDWAPILDSIKVNKSLKVVAIRSYFQLSSSTTLKKSHYFKRKSPAICDKDVTQWVATSLQFCLKISTNMKCLDLQGVPLRAKDVSMLAKGIEKNISLAFVSLNYCQVADKGVQILSHAIKNHPCITHLSLNGCNLSSVGTDAIAKLIKHQSMLRHSEAWAESLRYRTPNLNCMGGIRRISLNANPMIGDEGIAAFSEALKDDLWLKALDFQQCGISSKGALNLLETMQYNNTLVVLDIRQNPMIDVTTLRTVLGRALMNAKDNDEVDYPWVKEVAPKDPYCTKRYRAPRTKNRSLGRRLSRRSSRSSLDGAPAKAKASPKYKNPAAWLASIRASHRDQYQNRDVAEESFLFHLQSKPDTETSSWLQSDDITKSFLAEDNHLTLNQSQAIIRHLKIELINSQRKLHAALDSEKLLNAKLLAVETENARLRKELTVAQENSQQHSQIEDDMLLDSIEQSFNKFHDFLNKLHGAGLGSIASAAGLGHDFSLPFPSFNSAKNASLRDKISSKAESAIEKQKIVANGKARVFAVDSTEIKSDFSSEKQNNLHTVNANGCKELASENSEQDEKHTEDYSDKVVGSSVSSKTDTRQSKSESKPSSESSPDTF